MDEQAFADGLPTGTVLREYVIEAAIGQGGYGVVYRARHRYLGRAVALKEYFPTTVAVRTGGIVRPRSRSVTADYEEGLRRFIEEARRLEQFRSHAGVVTCLGFFEERGTAYLAMEYEDGLTLSDLLTKREAAASPLAEGELLQLAEQLLESLSAVHLAGVLHRDIKPSNILVRRSDERPVLIDFGAAKTDFAQYTKSYAPQTEGYAAIEQAEEDGELGPWTDLYGLGVVLWRIVAGGHRPQQWLLPVAASSRLFARLRSQDDPQPSARELGAGRFSSRLLSAIDKCLELDPKDRPATCEEMLALLSVPVRLGDIYYWGEGVTQDRALAAEWYRKAADQGDAIASRKLGFMNLWGLGVPQDRALAAMWYRKAADDGDTQAQLWLAYMHSWGAGVLRDAPLGDWVCKAKEVEDAVFQWFLDQSYRDERQARDPALALEWYRRAADDGEGEAQIWLGDSCRAPQYTDDIAFALECYHNAAKQGSFLALARLGDAYKEGEHVQRDFCWAVTYYEILVRDDNAEAQRKLGDTYLQCCDEHLRLNDPELAKRWGVEAADWYRKAAHQGNVRAQAELAVMYHKGEWVPRDDTLAALWFGKACDQADGWRWCRDGLVTMLNSLGAMSLAAEWLPNADNGCSIAPGLMGDLYRDGEVVRKDTSLAAEWYRKAADQGDADAQGTLGFMYYRGEGVPEDRALAAEWLGRAADQGNTWAKEWLGEMDRGGDRIPKVLAADWYRKAANRVQCLSEFMCLGGVDIWQGWFSREVLWGPYSPEPQWLRTAADMGSAVAQGLMGDLYCGDITVDGESVSRDYALAAEWYRKSAEQGNAWAQLRLGKMYCNGDGVPANPTVAVEWLGLAAKQGNTEAQQQLGDICRDREGTPKVLAAEWLRKAADEGNAIAQRLMGDIHRAGEGARKDTALAAEWYRKAADQDDRNALTCLGAMLHEGEGLSQGPSFGAGR